MRQCLQCGTDFEPKSSIHAFCSEVCRRAARRGDYPVNRKLAMMRDGQECQACKKAGRSTVGTDCHHKLPLCQGGDHSLGNLQTLCKPCHQNVHRSWKAYGQITVGGYYHAA